MRRFFALFAVLALCFATAGIAQPSCSAPTIVQIGGTNPLCPGQPATLDAGPGWVSYQWSNGATTQIITDAPPSTTTYTVTVTDANGCSVTSAPMTVSVAAAHVPQIGSSFGAVCPGGQPFIYAYSTEPGFTWASYDWTVTNGTLTGGANTASPQFTAGQSGTMAIELRVVDLEAGCSVGATYDIPIRVPETPAISSPASVGLTTRASAQVDPGCCSESLWTITGGTLEPDGMEGGPHTNRVFFTPDGSGPVTLTYTGRDSNGCSVTNSVTIPLATAPAPVINLYKSAVCLTEMNSAWIYDPTSSWVAYQWSIQNGVITDGANNDLVSFHGDGSGQPIVVSVLATNSGGLAGQASATAGMRTISAPAIWVEFSPTCPNVTNIATVGSRSNGQPWTSVVWSVANGTLLQTEGQNLQFTADGSGPVTLTAVVTDSNGCSATATQVVELKTITPQLNVQYSPSTQTAGNSAWVTQPAGSNYSSYLWSIEHGTFDFPPTDSYAAFHPDGSGTPRLTVTVTDSYGCSGTSSIDVPLATIPTPRISINYGKACPAVTNYGSIPQAPDGQSWATISWSITNGNLIGSTNDTYVSFMADGTAPATLSVTVTDGSGGSASDSVTLPLVAGGPPIQLSRPTACAGGRAFAGIDPAAGSFYGYYWSVTNAHLDSWPSDSYATYIPDGTGPVTITVSLHDSYGCPMTSSTVVNLDTLATPEITVSDPMSLNGGWAQLLDPNEVYTSATWTATHAYIASYGDFRFASIYPDGTGPVSVTCVAQTSDGCPVTVTREVLLEGNALMIDTAQPTLCGPVNRTASLFPSSGLSNIQWSITNGTILSGANDYNVSFHANGAADVTLSATATATGGTISATKVIRYEPFTVTTSGGSYYCPQYYSQFSVYGSVPVVNVAVSQAQNATTAILGADRFAAKVLDPSQPMSVTITATSADGCQTTSTVTQPSIDSLFGPVISLDHPALCATAQGHATISNAQPNVSYSWQIVNGALDSDVYGSSVTFHATGTAPVTLRAFAWPYYAACYAIREVTIPVEATPSASISGPGTLCAGSSITLTAAGGATYLWSNGATTPSITVTQPGTYSVTATTAGGCSATASREVTALAGSTATITASGPTSFCEGGSVQLTAGAGASYLWSNGATTQSITVTAGGTFTVTVTNANGCGATSTPTVVEVNSAPPTPVINLDTPQICPNTTEFATTGASGTLLWTAVNGTISGANNQSMVRFTAGSTGPVTLTLTVTNASGCSATSSVVVPLRTPTPPAISLDNPNVCPGGGDFANAPAGYTSYSWSVSGGTASGPTNQPHFDFTAGASGTITVTLTVSDNACTATNSATVNINTVATPTISASGPTTFCAGGEVTLTASAGSSYLWSNGATSRSITALSSGSYSVTVVDDNFCSATSAPTVVTIIAAPATPVVTPNGPTTFCEGGRVTLTAPESTSYLWSNGATSQSIELTTSGSFWVTVTNANGCSATSAPTTVTVNENPSTPVITADGPTTFCEGSSVTLTAPSSASYLWSNGATTQSINVTASGSYSVTVTNASGCTATSADTAVTVNAAVATPVITAGGATTFCAGGSVTLTASAADSHLWSNGATTQSINVTTSGSYSVTVTNGSGCSATSAATSVTVNANPSTPVITAGGATTFCDGGSVTLTAPSSASYLWSNGATTQSINVTTSGSFSVTVTNASGCSATSAATTVTVNPLPDTTVSVTGSPILCDGASVTLTAPAGYNYSWSNGATTQSITVSEPGSYSVTVTTGAGCSSVSAPVVVNNEPATVTVSGGAPIVCAGSSVHLTSSVAGGSATSYQWYGFGGQPIAGETSPTLDITPTMNGYYYVRITSANGCSVRSNVYVYNLDTPSATIAASGPTTFCSGGSVTLTANGGASYLWSNGATTPSINVTTSGSYSVTVTTANGCSATSAATTVTVNANPSTPVITAGGATTFCEGGSVTLTAPASASYLWSNGATTQSINVTTSGSYSVTVTNASGCSATSASTAVTVNANPSTPVITAGGATTFCDGGSVTLTAPSSTSYLWSNGATTQSINVTTSGSYSVTVTNASGCSATSAATTVTVNATPSTPVITAGGPTTFCAGGSVTLTAPSSTSYLWSNGATTQSINVTTSGSFSVTVTNASGCSATSASTTVTVNANPSTPVITAGGATTFCAGGSVTLTASAATSYLWSNGATTQSINVTTSGSYSVTVTNASGCNATSSATTVTVNAGPSTPVITAGGPTTFCAGGSVTLTAPSSASYLWSNGATTQSINVTTSGSYSVTVTNASGCSATSVATSVTVNTSPSTPTITAGGPTTFCAGGSVTLTAPASASYLWSNGATTQSINVATSGSYSVSVTNASGCSATSAATTVTVNASPSTPVITAGGPTTFCAGGSVTLTAPASTSYLWSNGATTQSINVTATGSYNVTVTNASGCSATSAATTVTVNANPSTPVITAGGPTTFCAGGSVTLTAPAGYTYAWSNGATTQSINVTTTGSYSVTVTNASGCSAISAATAVTVNAKPATPVITAGGSTAICPGSSVTLTAPAGFTYVWSNGATTQSINASSAGNYTVTVTNASGCSTTSAATAVTMKTTTSITQPANKTILRGEQWTFTVSASGTNLTYQWYEGSAGATNKPLGTQPSQLVGPYNKKGNFPFWVRVTGDCGVVSSSTITLTVN